MTSPPDVPNTTQQQARIIAAALLRRPAKPIATRHSWGTLAVAPFGLYMTTETLGSSTVGATPVVLKRTTAGGLVLNPQQSWPSSARAVIADVLNLIERLAGTKRVWDYRAPYDYPFRRAPSSLHYREDGRDDWTRIGVYDPHTVLDPLVSMMADATFANVTAKGKARDWRAECGRWLAEQKSSRTSAP